ncbi:MAG TPA: aminomethyltransferase family protein [Candidatus Cloacimonadota bacterium]|nr:aminomethyltransferase family protein [Candidatus Cloacimonadota bacterium]HPT72311.1 aminomethyltransferase family protein [Candidatus Cloacimonadota bacterium]
MGKIGFDVPTSPRKTVLYDLEENWYQPLLSQKLGRPVEPAKRSNFGQYDMAVNYLTSVLEESVAINNVAIYNIDHMAQIEFRGKDAMALLDRVLPADVAAMKDNQCKYTLLLNENGTVRDDLIIMRGNEELFILVINAGHDLTGHGFDDHGEPKEFLSDADFILSFMKPGDDVQVRDISADYVKIDIQGPLSYKLVKSIYGAEVLKNPNNPEKNMNFFTFNEFSVEGKNFYISRTGYTNRWGWELYVPVALVESHFKKIVSKALELGGLLVGLGGRDENRISAGDFGLPLMGQEYDGKHNPVGAPLFDAAIDLNKANFVGKQALENVIAHGTDKQMAVVISEGIVVGRGVYHNGKRIGTATSSINSPNVPLEKRLVIGSKRKSVTDPEGIAAIGICWLSSLPEVFSEEGKDEDAEVKISAYIPVEFFKEENGQPIGKPVLGIISLDGVIPATASKPLKLIENL